MPDWGRTMKARPAYCGELPLQFAGPCAEADDETLIADDGDELEQLPPKRPPRLMLREWLRAKAALALAGESCMLGPDERGPLLHSAEADRGRTREN